jgi:hypothetical protein
MADFKNVKAEMGLFRRKSKIKMEDSAAAIPSGIALGAGLVGTLP